MIRIMAGIWGFTLLIWGIYFGLKLKDKRKYRKLTSSHEPKLSEITFME